MSINTCSLQNYNLGPYSRAIEPKNAEILYRLKIKYPHSIELLEKEEALMDLMQLSEMVQELVLSYPKNFLKFKSKNALDSFLQLSEEMQIQALDLPENFLSLIDADMLSDFFKISSFLQERILGSHIYTNTLIEFKNKDVLYDFMKLSPRAQYAVLDYPELFLAIKKANAIYLLEENIRRLLIKLYQSNVTELSPAILANTADVDGITLLHRYARNGDLKRIDQFIHEIPESSIVLNPQVYFSSKTLADCKAPSTISQLDQIPLDQFAVPLLVAQNYCNTLIKMKDGSILTLQHTDAKQVYDALSLRAKTEGVFRVFINGMQKLIGIYTPPTLENNRLSVFINPGHGFLALDCTSCAEGGASFHNPIGFLGHFGDDFGGLSHSEEHQLLKISFPISDEQAKAVWKKQNSLRQESSGIDYRPFSNNCIDYATAVFEAVGEPHPYHFFTEDQLKLSYSQRNLNLAIQYARIKYKYNTPIDTIISATHLASLFITYEISKFFYKKGKTYLSSAYRFIRKNPKEQKIISEDTKRAQSEQKLSTYIKTGLANIAGHGLRHVSKVVTGVDSPILAAATKYSLFACAVLLYEVVSSGPLDKNKTPSLWNKNISLYVASGLAAAASSLSVELARKVTDPSATSNAVFFGFTINAVFFSLVGINEIRKLYHSLTEPPNIDGMSLE